MKKFVYADNAATTQLDMEAFEAMKPFLLSEYGNPSQPYSFSRSAKKALSESRAVIAECIGAQPEEIYFTSGGTESDNWAIKGSALVNEEKRAMITSTLEHHAILRASSAIERLGYPVAYLAPTKEGIITGNILKSEITDNTFLVSVMFANNEIGSIQPISDLSAISHEHGAFFHTDAVQGIGHVPLKVNDYGIDMLSASAHKFHGPRGIGFLYVKNGVPLAPILNGGNQEFGMRAGTQNVPAIVGMAYALKKSCAQLNRNIEYIRSLERILLTELNGHGVLFARNGGDHTLPGLVSLSFPGLSGETILHRLDLKGIAVSTGSACDGQNTEISHVLKAIKLEESRARGTIRISLGDTNDEEDVIIIANAIAEIVKSRG